MRKLISALLLILLVVWNVPSVLAEPASMGAEVTNAPTVKEDPSLLTAKDLTAEAAVLIDAESGNILFAKNDKVRMHPASTTKVMTLLLGIESGIGLDTVITIPQAAANVPTDSTLIPVYPGESMTFGDLLVGFTMNSGNDGANAIAVLVSGSIDAFVELMNRRAEEIGCVGTHFANAHGYTSDQHYTTAYDMALIARTAMHNTAFREIVNTRKTTIHVRERGDISIKTSNKLMDSESSFFDGDCIGIKTGTTSAAGKCFVGAAQKDGAILISVVFNCPEDNDRWRDTELLFRFGWTCYDTYSFSDMFEIAGPRIASFAVSNAASDDPYGGTLTLNIAHVNNDSYMHKIERGNDAALTGAVQDFIQRSRVEISHSLTAPISVGEIIGAYSYASESGELITATLVAGRDVAEKPAITSIFDYFPKLSIVKSRWLWILLGVLFVLIVLISVLAARRRAEKQRRRRRIYEQKQRRYRAQQQAQRRSGHPVRGQAQRRRSGR